MTLAFQWIIKVPEPGGRVGMNSIHGVGVQCQLHMDQPKEILRPTPAISKQMDIGPHLHLS